MEMVKGNGRLREMEMVKGNGKGYLSSQPNFYRKGHICRNWVDSIK